MCMHWGPSVFVSENEKKSEAPASEVRQQSPTAESSNEPVLQVHAEPDEKVEEEQRKEPKKPQESVRPTVKSVSSKPNDRAVSSRRVCSMTSKRRYLFRGIICEVKICLDEHIKTHRMSGKYKVASLILMSKMP